VNKSIGELGKAMAEGFGVTREYELKNTRNQVVDTEASGGGMALRHLEEKRGGVESLE
jgi:hypothetical protein